MVVCICPNCDRFIWVDESDGNYRILRKNYIATITIGIFIVSVRVVCLCETIFSEKRPYSIMLTKINRKDTTFIENSDINNRPSDLVYYTQ